MIIYCFFRVVRVSRSAENDNRWRAGCKLSKCSISGNPKLNPSFSAASRNARTSSRRRSSLSLSASRLQYQIAVRRSVTAGAEAASSLSVLSQEWLSPVFLSRVTDFSRESSLNLSVFQVRLSGSISRREGNHWTPRLQLSVICFSVRLKPIFSGVSHRFPLLKILLVLLFQKRVQSEVPILNKSLSQYGSSLA